MKMQIKTAQKRSSNIPKSLTPKLKEIMNNDPFMKSCIYENKLFADIEWEHSSYYSGRKIHELWAIVPVRMQYNRNPTGKQKRFHQWVAHRRWFAASQEYKAAQQRRYPKHDFYGILRTLEDEFSLNDFPELSSRIYKYRIEL